LTLWVGRQEGRPACKKLEWWGASMVVCLERGAHLHMAQLVPLPLTISCFIKIHMPLLMATSILGLGRCHSSSPQQCYLCVCVCV